MSVHMRLLDELELAGKTVLVRCDLNLPVKDGKVLDLTRIKRLVPSLHELAEHKCKIVLMSHFGRPNGKANQRYSLQLVKPALEQELNLPLYFAPECVGPTTQNMAKQLQSGECLLLENLRFHPGEQANDPSFAQLLASLGECYINEAFASIHRQHASTVQLAHLLPSAAGRLVHQELSLLSQTLEYPERPLVAIIGGSKLSTKLALLERLASKVDVMALGGTMANNFLAHSGVQIADLCSESTLTVDRIVQSLANAGHELWLPSDVIVAPSLQLAHCSRAVAVNQIPAGEKIFDVGPDSVRDLANRLATCKTLIWNGPVGAFEHPPFDEGTTFLARKVADLTTRGQISSVAGGGSTLAALAQAGVAERFSYLSTAGGAFLAWLEGRPLPAIAALSS